MQHQVPRKSSFRYLFGIGLAFAVALVSPVPCAAAPSVAPSHGYDRGTYVLPPQTGRTPFQFAGVTIPLDRRGVLARVQEELNFLLMDRRAKLLEWFDRMGLYGPSIKPVLAEEGVPEDLIYFAVLQSDLTPHARKGTGGAGWWALAPQKGKKGQPPAPWAATEDWDDRRDPVLATRIAAGTLKGLLAKTNDNDWLVAICAYADGADKVEEIAAKAKGFSYWDMVMPPYSEHLIPRLIALKLIDTYRAYYGLNVPQMPPASYDFLGRLKLLKDLPLHVVAKWCGITPRAMWELNPGVSATTGLLPKADKIFPEGLPIRVPKGTAQKVQQHLRRDGYVAN
ncbi:MAG: transglycosylase SLT domain-containing protein [Desulfomonile tiedjei]|nr:transglycosylase SLT domain-containing protein [Desulfomonile tiedjei]